MSDGFWDKVNAQLDELREAGSADDVLRILSRERNPYGPDHGCPNPGEGFFAGSGGERSVRESLRENGWLTVWSEASYFYVMRAPNGDLLTYCEGDVARGVAYGAGPV